MSPGYYQPGEQRATRVRDLFGSIARRYDLLNDLQSFGLHRWWKQRLVREANPAPGKLLLDLCCGTGDIALRLAKAGAEVVGVDFSEPMLAVARRRIRPGMRIEFVQADALNLPFAPSRFDTVTVAYGLRNLADPEAGVQEMARVTRPGGRLLVLDFGKPVSPWWRAAYFAYLRLAVPWMGRWFSGDREAYAYILESLRHYPAQAGVRRWLEALPGARVREINFLGGVMSLHVAVLGPVGGRPG